MEALLGLIFKLGAVLKVGQIVYNLPKLFRFYKTFGPIAAEVFEKRKVPSGEEGRAFLRAAADLLRAKLIDIPDVDEDAVAKMLEELAAESEK